MEAPKSFKEVLREFRKDWEEKYTTPVPLPILQDKIEMCVDDWAKYYMNGALCFDEGHRYTPDKIISLIQTEINGTGVPYSPQKIARRVAKFLREQGGVNQWDKVNLFRTPMWDTMLRNAEQNRKDRAHRLSFGIEGLDEACGGVYGGNMLGIFGNPGSHKTMLLTNAITQWIQDGGTNIWLYELDMGAPAMVDRLLAKELRCSPKMLRGLMGTKEYVRAKNQVKKFYGDHLHIMDRTNSIGKRWTIEDVIEGIERFEPEIVAIDYLTCLELEGQKKPNEHELAKTVSKRLCDTAQRYGTLIITLSQMSQSSQQIQKSSGHGAMPMGGTDVWNDSDVMIELQSDIAIDEKGNPKSNIIAVVRKSRTDGKIGRAFKLEADYGRFKSTSEVALRANANSRKPLYIIQSGSYIP